MGDGKEHGEDLDDGSLDDDVFEDCIARVRPAGDVTPCQFPYVFMTSGTGIAPSSARCGAESGVRRDTVKQRKY